MCIQVDVVFSDGVSVLNVVYLCFVDMVEFSDGEVVFYVEDGGFEVIQYYCDCGGWVVFLCGGVVVLVQGLVEMLGVNIEVLLQCFGVEVIDVFMLFVVVVVVWVLGILFELIVVGFDIFVFDFYLV